MEISISTQPAARGTQVLPLALPLDVEIAGRRFRVRRQNRAFLAFSAWVLEAVADGRVSRIEMMENRRYRIVCRPDCIREVAKMIDDLLPPTAARTPPGNGAGRPAERPPRARRPILTLKG